MKKIISGVLVLIFLLLFTACSTKREDRDFDIHTYDAMGASEEWHIETYNNYRNVSKTVEKDEYGAYIITFKFQQSR